MQFRAVKGMNDVLPGETERWQRLELSFRRTAALYGFSEVRTPIVEPLELFVHATGETSEIVEKQMFEMERGGERLALRPEGTPGAARAFLDASLHAKEPVTRWYYLGQMFRAEQPQRGRYRQFNQAGCELYGDPGPIADAEVIALLHGFLQDVGVKELDVIVNSIGGPGTRARFREALVTHLSPQRDALSEHAQRRLLDNPLRILDSKDPRDRAALNGAPSILDLLDEPDRQHWDGLRRALDALGTPYRVDPGLVRGLDYYTRTLFEVQSSSGELGTQNALGGGGRYDGMLKGLGGPDLPAIGFALGLERLLLALGSQELPREKHCFIAPLGERAALEGLKLAAELRTLGVRCEIDGRGGSLKSLLRRASALNASVCLVLGDNEIDRGVVQAKDLDAHSQSEIPRTEAAARIRALLAGEAAN
jgi:histidyl-tRNA synthetase